jgi:hypothetical protein
MVQELNLQIDSLKQQRDKIKLDLDKTIKDLIKSRTDVTLIEERKNESEICYKNEIKYLIEKLLKLKSKLSRFEDSKSKDSRR